MEPTRDADSFDLVVVGGGVNGTGIARDAALRGVRTLLVEKRDFACGASGANGGMIHGGFRYMLHDTRVTRLSCVDSGYIQKIAPHLLFRVVFILPLAWRRDGGGRKLGEKLYDYAMEVYFATYDRYQPFKNGRPHTRLSPEEALRIEPGLSPEMHGALTMDEWGIDPFRLCALSARAAADAGATVLTYTQATGLLREGGRVVGVRLRDAHTGATRDVRARVVFNAAGPWATRVAGLAGAPLKMRPGKGVHLTLDRRLSSYGLATFGIDGRQIYAIPHESSTVVGTTDDDFYGDPDDIPIVQDEVEYLLQAVERAFPSVRQARVLRAWAGVRNTLHAWGPNEDRLSREHEVTDHARDGADGLYSLVGGKLASFRAQAEHATDVVCARLGVPERCRTHLVPLPGGGAAPSPAELAEEFGVSLHAASRVAYRHGSEAPRVLSLAREDRALADPVCRCEGTTGAELVFAIRHEWARHLVDLRRRCRLAMGPCQGTRCLGRAAALLARERSLDADETQGEMMSLLAERWKGMRAVAAGEGLAQAELMRHAWLGSAALRADAPRGAGRR